MTFTCTACSHSYTETIDPTGITVNLYNYTIEGDNLATVTVNGEAVEYKNKEAVEVTLDADGKFTVNCARACVVAISLDNGETFEEMTCTAVDGKEDTYEFTMLEEADTIQIFVGLRGDVRLDGRLNGFDKTALAKGMLSEDMENYAALDTFSALVADIRIDGRLNGFDKTTLAKGMLSEDMENYEALKWNIAK